MKSWTDQEVLEAYGGACGGAYGFAKLPNASQMLVSPVSLSTVSSSSCASKALPATDLLEILDGCTIVKEWQEVFSALYYLLASLSHKISSDSFASDVLNRQGAAAAALRPSCLEQR